jgi:hypothetical protein
MTKMWRRLLCSDYNRKRGRRRKKKGEEKEQKEKRMKKKQKKKGGGTRNLFPKPTRSGRLGGLQGPKEA